MQGCVNIMDVKYLGIHIRLSWSSPEFEPQSVIKGASGNIDSYILCDELVVSVEGHHYPGIWSGLICRILRF